MRILFLLFAVFLVLYQAAPGNAVPDTDTMACASNGGSCSFGTCRGINVENIGTCRNGALVCCKWARPGP